MSNPNQLYLLADHIKLSLLERQRAQSLNLDADSKDGHISRSLDQFRDGLAAIQKEKARLEEAGDEEYVLSLCRRCRTSADICPTIGRASLD